MGNIYDIPNHREIYSHKGIHHTINERKHICQDRRTIYDIVGFDTVLEEKSDNLKF